MTSEIKIFNPASEPFGCLSNNYKQKRLSSYNVKIDNVSCITLTNYIYARLLKSNTNKQVICAQKDYTTVRKKFIELNNSELLNVLKTSIMTALDVMFSNSPELTSLLLSTKNSDIKYINDFLGTESDGLDKNLYGICLKEQRQKIIYETKQKEKTINKEKELQSNYEIYIAYQELSTLVKNGRDIRHFLKKNIEDIIKELGKEKLESFITKTNFSTQYERKNKVIMEIKELYEYPHNLVPYILKLQLPLLLEKNGRKIKKRIFSMYADYLLDRKFKHVNIKDYEKAKEQHFLDPSFQLMATDLEDRLYYLYTEGMLSDNLCNDIDKDSVIKSYSFPSRKDVEDAINYPLSYDKKDLKDSFDQKTTGEIFVFPPSSRPLDPKYNDHLKYTSFSPLSFFKTILRIESFQYITVIHYVIVKLLVHIGIEHSKAYTYILEKKDVSGKYTKDSFINPAIAINIYNRQKQQVDKDNLIKYAVEGLKIKFLDNRVLQDFLLATGNATLIYDDQDNNILKNVVGNELMKIREEIRRKREINDSFDLLKTEDITFIFQNDSFMNNWVQKRVFDSCKTLTIMKDYLKNKYKKTVEISPKFTEMVLDNIYQPCSEVYGAAHEITAKVPDYFIKMVEKCNITPFDNKIIDVIWKRLAVVIYYLIKHLKTKNKLKTKIKIQDISSEIVRTQELINTFYQCQEIIKDDNYGNCIASAIINLICGIFKFNDKISKSKSNITITEHDVQAAVSIILETVNVTIPEEGPEEEGPEEDIELGPEEEYIEEGPEEEGLEELVFNLESDEESGYETDDGSHKYDSDSNSPYSPGKNHAIMIKDFLETLEEFDHTDKDVIAKIIENAVRFIKKNTIKISNKVKKNRINFFAKQR
jgi:predicted NAD-dependent protein-ADP-ribosyltransferase YbiA (DUF1768 family)